jgi:hypothetical protein
MANPNTLALVEQLRIEFDNSALRTSSSIGDLKKTLEANQSHYTSLIDAIETALGGSFHLSASTLVIPFLTALANDAATKAVLGLSEKETNVIH